MVDGSFPSAMGFDDGRSDGLVVFRLDVGVCDGGSGEDEFNDVSLPGEVDGSFSDEGGLDGRVRVKSCTLHRSLVKHVSPSGHSFPVGQCDSIEHFTVPNVSPQKRMLRG